MLVHYSSHHVYCIAMHCKLLSFATTESKCIIALVDCQHATAALDIDAKQYNIGAMQCNIDAMQCNIGAMQCNIDAF